MIAWFEISELQNKVGIITDFFVDYIELREAARGQYYIVHESKVRIIKENPTYSDKIRQNRFY